MMRFSYDPVKIKQAANEIRKMHTVKVKANKENISSEIKDFISEVCSLPDENVEPYADLLSYNKLFILSEYITQNNFHTDLKNIIKILKYRMNPDIFQTIYKNWQNYYRDHFVPECGELLLSAIKTHHSDIKYITDHNLDPYFEVWLNSDEIDCEVCRTLIQYSIEHKNCNFEDAAKHYDISGSVIASEAFKWYFCCCGSTVFLNMTDEKLYDETKSYNSKFVKRFLLNFLKCLNVNQLMKYRRIWEMAYNNIGEPGFNKFNYFFTKDIENSESLKKKYTQWHYIHQMYDIFGGDERSKFWQGKVLDYDASEYQYIKSKEALIMLFGNYYIIEFKNIGALYIFSKKYYLDNIKRYFDSSQTVTEIKSALFHAHVNREGFYNRYEHRGQWKGIVSNQLRKLLGR